MNLIHNFSHYNRADLNKVETGSFCSRTELKPTTLQQNQIEMD